jgi:hypothetical protein
VVKLPATSVKSGEMYQVSRKKGRRTLAILGVLAVPRAGTDRLRISP